jgi:small subunit ribosomal protein S8
VNPDRIPEVETDKAMNNQDPIADMLTRIRNANRVGRRMVMIPKSKICTGIAQVLKDEGYIDTYDVIDDERQGQIRVRLKYSMSGEKVIHVLDRASKPGCRLYRGVKELPQVLNGMGIAVVSTSKGVMSDRKAREANVGGELLCVVS